MFDQTLTVLNPLNTPSPHIMDDSDLYGGLLFLILYGTFLALSGKFFYGYIYGIALFGSMALHFIFSLMTPAVGTDDGVMDGHAQSGRDHGVTSPIGGMSGHGGGMGGGSGGHFSSTLTYSRSASVLGYCFLPLVITALLGVALPMDSLIGYVLTCISVGWCTFSSSGMFVSVGRMRGMRARFCESQYGVWNANNQMDNISSFCSQQSTIYYPEVWEDLIYGGKLGHVCFVRDIK